MGNLVKAVNARRTAAGKINRHVAGMGRVIQTILPSQTVNNPVNFAAIFNNKIVLGITTDKGFNMIKISAV